MKIFGEVERLDYISRKSSTLKIKPSSDKFILVMFLTGRLTVGIKLPFFNRGRRRRMPNIREGILHCRMLSYE